jgi:membrane-associated HD superfamily phosphohydrolase
MKMVSSIGTEILNWDGMLLKQYVAEKNLSKLLGIATLILLFVVFEEKMEQTMKQDGLSRWIQMLIVSTLLILIGVTGVLGKEEFIYFQF